jgi:UDP-2,3-diacylglucosamine hydrolase
MSHFEPSRFREIRFVGDTHFRDRSLPGEAERRTRFFAFLESVPGDTALYLIGDIFDFYFEYRSVVHNRHLDVLSALRRCGERGVELHFIGGNHDHWVGRFFAEETGCRVHENEIRFEAQGRRVVVSHGDLVMPRDLGYKLLKSIIRNRAVIAVSRWIHPDLMARLARDVSDGSRSIRRHDQEQRARAVTEWAHEKFFSRGNDVYVMGHVHYPVYDVRNGNEFLIVGDWIDGSTFGLLADGRLSLETFRS